MAPPFSANGTYGYYPTPFRPETPNYKTNFSGAENINGGGARNAQLAIILYQAAAWLGAANNGLVVLEAAVCGERLHGDEAGDGIAGLRTCIYQYWVFLTTRFEMVAFMRLRQAYALDLARAILAPRKTGKGGVATAAYHRAAAVAQATAIARVRQDLPDNDRPPFRRGDRPDRSAKRDRTARDSLNDKDCGNPRLSDCSR